MFSFLIHKIRCTVLQFICQHDYVNVAFHPCHESVSKNDGIFFYECRKCSKRRFYVKYEYWFRDWYIDKCKMWEKGYYRLEKGDARDILESYLHKDSISFLENCLRKDK